MLQKIALKDKIDESREFATRIQSALYAAPAKTNPAAKNRGIKKAPFIGASMELTIASVRSRTVITTVAGSGIYGPAGDNGPAADAELIRDDTGAVLLSTTLALPAMGHTSFNLAPTYSLTAGIRGTVEFDTPSGGQIGVLGLRFESGRRILLGSGAGEIAGEDSLAYARIPDQPGRRGSLHSTSTSWAAFRAQYTMPVGCTRATLPIRSACVRNEPWRRKRTA
ncbi:MAG: hypothetical protein ACRD4P_01665 [Bryobacteraceae bacterium]